MTIKPLHITQSLLVKALIDEIEKASAGVSRVDITKITGVTEDGATLPITHGLVLELTPAAPKKVAMPSRGKLRLVSNDYGREVE